MLNYDKEDILTNQLNSLNSVTPNIKGSFYEDEKCLYK